jgi:hypothetical protein
MSALSPMQKRYLLLAGMHEPAALVQGRGYRTKKTKYALPDGGDEIVVFGYQNPAEFMEQRGLLRKLQARHSYTLTDEGKKQFAALVLSGEAKEISREVELVKVKR